MSETVIVANNSETKTAPAMGKFERYLTLWVALCFIATIALGQVIPAVFRAIGAATVAEANLPVAQLFINWLFKSYLPQSASSTAMPRDSSCSRPSLAPPWYSSGATSVT